MPRAASIKPNSLRRVFEVTGTPTVQALARAIAVAEEEYGEKVRTWRVEWSEAAPKARRPHKYIIEAALPFSPPDTQEE